MIQEPFQPLPQFFSFIFPIVGSKQERIREVCQGRAFCACRVSGRSEAESLDEPPALRTIVQGKMRRKPLKSGYQLLDRVSAMDKRGIPQFIFLGVAVGFLCIGSANAQQNPVDKSTVGTSLKQGAETVFAKSASKIVFLVMRKEGQIHARDLKRCLAEKIRKRKLAHDCGQTIQNSKRMQSQGLPTTI